MNRSLTLLALAIAFGATSAVPAFAQKSPDPAQAGAAQAEKTQDAPKKDPKTEEYEKAIKDLKKLEGGITLYQRKKELLLELPESKLNEIFLLQAAFHTGVMGDGLTAGFPADGFGNIQAFRFERNEDSVLLVRPNLRYQWQANDPFALANERSFPPATIQTFRIENTNPEKKLLLVNVSNLFYGDAFRLNEAISQGLAGPYTLERDKSGPEFAKAYPENTVVRMKLHYFNPRPDGGSDLAMMLGLSSGDQLEDPRSAPIKVTYNMWWRKPSDYMPRLADPRVGFFTTDYFNIGRFYQDDRVERYINRWDLRKKDPKAAVSEAVNPIVWVIDDSVPVQFRKATKEGILYWNRAFEALGYKNAVQVIDKPNDPDYDHADGRYNVVRWTMSEDAGYAIALFRTDPFSGQILNASVNFDANMVNYIFQEYNKILTPATSRPASMVDRAIEVLTSRFENTHPNVDAGEYVDEGPLAIHKASLKQKEATLGWNASGCDYANYKAEQAKFAWSGLMAVTGGRPKVSFNDYIDEFIRDVTSHEVGHCMGLRHNFIASKMHTTAELANDKALRDKGITTSVMEYTPVNVMAVLKGGGVFYAPRVGPYDIHAIKYGYTDVPSANSPQGEKFMLSRIASASAQPNLRWMSDENADSFDPDVVRFDMAKDQIAYSAKNLEVASKVLHYALNDVPASGRSYAERTAMVMQAMRLMFREGNFSARFVGGLNGSKNFKGDANEKPTLRPVSAAEQRAATVEVGLIDSSTSICSLPASRRWCSTPRSECASSDLASS